MRAFLILILLLGLAGGASLLLRGDSARDAPPGEGANATNAGPETGAEGVGANRTSTDSSAAASALQESSAALSAEGSRLNRAGIDALEAQRYQEAIELFERCLDSFPDEPVFAHNLAEALARWARHELELDATSLEQSILALERALLLHPEREDLSALLERWKAAREAEEEFWTDETEHFLLSYDGDRAELLKHGYAELTALLEQVYFEFQVLLNHEPVAVGEAKIQVRLYNREQFTAVTGVGHWAGGIYDGTVRIPVKNYAAERREIERVLRHELVHAFLRSYGGKDVPAWLNEGLAQWLETRPSGTRVAVARGSLTGAKLFPLGELSGSFASWKDKQKITLAYAQSVVFVDHLITWYGEQLVFELIRGCGQGKTCQETFRARTAQDLSVVASDFAREL